MKLRALLLLAFLVSAACSPVGSGDESTTTAVDAPAVELDIEYGRNEDGTFYQGAADAPVTLIDYSDFL